MSRRLLQSCAVVGLRLPPQIWFKLMLFLLLVLMSKLRSLAGGARRCYSSITSVWQYCYQIFQVLTLMMKQPAMLFIFPSLLTVSSAESDVSTHSQYQVPFLFLSVAIAIVYCTLLFVYIFRYRIFRKSATIEIDSQGNSSQHNGMQLQKDDRYFALNRFLHRLKTNGDILAD